MGKESGGCQGSGEVKWGGELGGDISSLGASRKFWGGMVGMVVQQCECAYATGL